MLDKKFDPIRADIANQLKELITMCAVARGEVTRLQRETKPNSPQAREAGAVYNYLNDTCTYLEKAIASMNLASQWDSKLNAHASIEGYRSKEAKRIEEINRLKETNISNISKIWRKHNGEDLA